MIGNQRAASPAVRVRDCARGLSPAIRQRLWGTVAVLALVALPFAVYRQLLDPAWAPADFDAFAYIYPYRSYLAHAWSDGRWVPLWNPSIYLGAPLLANIQAAALYPLSLVFLAVRGPAALGWSMVLHLAIAGVGMFAYASRAARLRVAGAMVAASAYVLSSHLTVHLAQINQISTLAWTPWLMLAFDRAVARPGARAVAAIAVLSALTVLAGHTQQAYLTFLTGSLAGALALGSSLAARRWRRASLGVACWAVGGMLGAGLAAAQLLPTLELTRQSYRQGGLSIVAADVEPLPLNGLVGSLLPHYSGPVPPEFAGASTAGVVLLLATFAVVARWRHPPVAMWGVVSALAIWAATGAAGGLFILLFHLLPGLNLFRAPGRLLLLSTIGIALLAGHGTKTAQQLVAVRGRREWRRRALWAAAVTASVCALVGSSLLAGRLAQARTAPWLGWALPVTGRRDVLLLAAFAMAAGLAGAIAARWAGRSAAVALGIALVTLAAGESWLATQSYHTRRAVPAALYTAPRPIDALVPPGPERRYLSLVTVTDLGDFTRLGVAARPNVGMEDGRLTADGYDGGLLPISRYVDFRRPVLDPAASNAPDLTVLDQARQIWDPSWLERAGVAGVLTDANADPNPPTCRCLRHGAAVDGVALWQLDGPEPTRAWVLADGVRQPAHVLQDRGELVVVSLPQHSGGLLVLADADYPSWSASVDGRHTEIKRYDGTLRAVAVPAGARKVVFSYEPVSFRVGAIVSVASLLVTLALSILPAVRRRRGRQAAARRLRTTDEATLYHAGDNLEKGDGVRLRGKVD